MKIDVWELSKWDINEVVVNLFKGTHLLNYFKEIAIEQVNFEHINTAKSKRMMKDLKSDFEKEKRSCYYDSSLYLCYKFVFLKYSKVALDLIYVLSWVINM